MLHIYLLQWKIHIYSSMKIVYFRAKFLFKFKVNIYLTKICFFNANKYLLEIFF